MFNMIKMDLFRMFRTRSLYIIGIIMAAVLVLTAFLETTATDEYMEEMSQKTQQEISEDNLNVGMSVSIIPDENGEISILNEFMANAGAKSIAIFLVIFAVIYATADYTSGYIKNIAGQVKRRRDIVFSKAVTLFIYAVMSFAWFFAVQIAAHILIYGSLEWGNVKDLLTYAALQIVLNYALMIIVMTISIVLRNNLVSMIIAICLCMNVMVILYSGIDKILDKIGIHDFDTIKYTVTGRISMLQAGGPVKENIIALIISCVFIAAGIVISSVVFKKRDVV